MYSFCMSDKLRGTWDVVYVLEILKISPKLFGCGMTQRLKFFIWTVFIVFGFNIKLQCCWYRFCAGDQVERI